MDRGFVTGPALVDAAEHEAKIAVYPRVVLTDLCTEVAVRDARTYRTVAESPWNEQVLVDADGRVFVDYLVALKDSPVEEQVLAGLRAHREKVSAALGDFVCQPRIAEKYQWVVAYHNYTCRRWRLKQALIDESDQPQSQFGRVFRTLSDCLS